LKPSGLKYLSTSVTTSGVINIYVIPKCFGEKVKVYCERCQVKQNPDPSILFANSIYYIPTINENEPIPISGSNIEFYKGTNFVLDILF